MTTIKEVHSFWEVPYVAHFCSLFRTAFNLSDFDIEDLEESLSDNDPDSNFLLVDLISRILNGCYLRKDIGPANYDVYLHDIFKQRLCVELQQPNPLESQTFFQLSCHKRVQLLQLLCDFRLDADDVSEVLKGLNGDSMRVEPLGTDAGGAKYWYFYGTRLYKEDPAPPVSNKCSRKTKGKKKMSSTPLKRMSSLKHGACSVSIPICPQQAIDDDNISLKMDIDDKDARRGKLLENFVIDISSHDGHTRKQSARLKVQLEKCNEVDAEDDEVVKSNDVSDTGSANFESTDDEELTNQSSDEDYVVNSQRKADAKKRKEKRCVKKCVEEKKPANVTPNTTSLPQILRHPPRSARLRAKLGISGHITDEVFHVLDREPPPSVHSSAIRVGMTECKNRFTADSDSHYCHSSSVKGGIKLSITGGQNSSSTRHLRKVDGDIMSYNGLSDSVTECDKLVERHSVSKTDSDTLPAFSTQESIETSNVTCRSGVCERMSPVLPDHGDNTLRTLAQSCISICGDGKILDDTQLKTGKLDANGLTTTVTTDTDISLNSEACALSCGISEKCVHKREFILSRNIEISLAGADAVRNMDEVACGCGVDKNVVVSSSTADTFCNVEAGECNSLNVCGSVKEDVGDHSHCDVPQYISGVDESLSVLCKETTHCSVTNEPGADISKLADDHGCSCEDIAVAAVLEAGQVNDEHLDVKLCLLGYKSSVNQNTANSTGCGQNSKKAWKPWTPSPESLETGWHIVCEVVEDWKHLSCSLADGGVLCEKQLYRTIVDDFLPELPAIQLEKEKERNRSKEEVPARRLSTRLLYKRKEQQDKDRILQEAQAEEDLARTLEEEDRKKRQEEEKLEEQRRQREERERAREERARRVALREERARLIAEGKEIPPELMNGIRNESPSTERSSQLDEEMVAKLHRVLSACVKHSDAWPFVDAVEEKFAPGYFDIITCPMDLSEMETKLSGGCYGSKQEFVADMNLIIENCIKYNGVSSDFSVMARNVRNAFQRALRRYFPIVSSQKDDADFTVDRSEPVVFRKYRSRREASKRAANNFMELLSDDVDDDDDAVLTYKTTVSKNQKVEQNSLFPSGYRMTHCHPVGAARDPSDAVSWADGRLTHTSSRSSTVSHMPGDAAFGLYQGSHCSNMPNIQCKDMAPVLKLEHSEHVGRKCGNSKPIPTWSYREYGVLLDDNPSPPKPCCVKPAVGAACQPKTGGHHKLSGSPSYQPVGGSTDQLKLAAADASGTAHVPKILPSDASAPPRVQRVMHISKDAYLKLLAANKIKVVQQVLGGKGQVVQLTAGLKLVTHQPTVSENSVATDASLSSISTVDGLNDAPTVTHSVPCSTEQLTPSVPEQNTMSSRSVPVSESLQQFTLVCVPALDVKPSLSSVARLVTPRGTSTPVLHGSSFLTGSLLGTLSCVLPLTISPGPCFTKTNDASDADVTRLPATVGLSGSSGLDFNDDKLTPRTFIQPVVTCIQASFHNSTCASPEQKLRGCHARLMDTSEIAFSGYMRKAGASNIVSVDEVSSSALSKCQLPITLCSSVTKSPARIVDKMTLPAETVTFSAEMPISVNNGNLLDTVPSLPKINLTTGCSVHSCNVISTEKQHMFQALSQPPMSTSEHISVPVCISQPEATSGGCSGDVLSFV